MVEQQQGANKVKGVVDIVFLMDATGSMKTCIDQLKENVILFVDSLVAPKGNDISPVKDWRARVVGYRDAEADAATWFVDNPFTRDVSLLKGQLDALEATGGGDEPESLLDALYKVASVGQMEKGAQEEDPTKWRYRSSAARVVIVFSDATYKEKMSIPEAAGGGLSDVVNVVASNRVVLSIFAPEMECFHELGAIDKAEYVPIPMAPGGSAQKALAEFTKDPANFKETLLQLAKSVSKSAETVAL